ncbi:hypothetical protein CR513_08951, partial [Mucuna pruriens]
MDLAKETWTCKLKAYLKAKKKGKQVKGSFESKNIISTSRPLELLHIDQFSPTRIASISGKHYGLVVVDDYSKWTWVMFLTHKDESFKVFYIFYKKVQNKKAINIASIKSDHGENLKMKTFKGSMKNMVSFIIFPIQEHHNIMDLWKGKIYIFKRWKKPC